MPELTHLLDLGRLKSGIPQGITILKVLTVYFKASNSKSSKKV